MDIDSVARAVQAIHDIRRADISAADDASLAKLLAYLLFHVSLVEKEQDKRRVRAPANDDLN